MEPAAEAADWWCNIMILVLFMNIVIKILLSLLSYKIFGFTEKHSPICLSGLPLNVSRYDSTTTHYVWYDMKWMIIPIMTHCFIQAFASKWPKQNKTKNKNFNVKHQREKLVCVCVRMFDSIIIIYMHQNRYINEVNCYQLILFKYNFKPTMLP